MTIQSAVEVAKEAQLCESQNALFLPDNFPVRFSPERQNHLLEQVNGIQLEALSLMEVSRLGTEVEQNLHRTLDKFMERIDAIKDPKIFHLIPKLSATVEDAKLSELADEVLNPKINAWDKFRGVFSKKSLSTSFTQAANEVRLLVSAKTKKLADEVTNLEKQLNDEKVSLEKEIKVQELLKQAYQERFDEFAQLCALLYGLLNKSRREFAAMQADSLIDSGRVQDFSDKLQALESRTLSVETLLTRLPSDQLVIRQLQNAGIATLQETTTSASGRFASIKMTLLTIHGAQAVQDLQRLGQQGADLDRNLLAVRGTLMKQIVGEAVAAPGRNRLAQAEQIQFIVNQTRELHGIYLQAQQETQQKFSAAKQILSDARTALTSIGATIQPNKALPI